MPAMEPLTEFRSNWLPNISDTGLSRLIELMDSGNPLLIRGAFTRAVPMGCLASHIAWNHPATQHIEDEEAGVCWLTRVAGLNPATSAVILAWDCGHDRDLVAALLTACRDEQTHRASEPAEDCLPEVAATI